MQILETYYRGHSKVARAHLLCQPFNFAACVTKDHCFRDGYCFIQIAECFEFVTLNTIDIQEKLLAS